VRICAFFCLLVFLACSAPPEIRRVDPALATLIPPEAVALAGVRLDRLENTPLYETLRPFLMDHLPVPLAKGAANAELWELLGVLTPKDTLWMTRGRFSASGIEPRLTWDGARRTAYRGYLMITDGRLAVTFMNATTALAGRPGRLRTVIDQRDTGAQPPADLLSLAGGIGASCQMWAVARGGRKPPPDLPEPVGRLLADILPKLRHARVTIEARDTLLLTAEAECRTPDDAETLRSAANAFIGFTRLQRNRRPALREALDLLSVQREGTLVRLAVELPAPLLEELLAAEETAP